MAALSVWMKYYRVHLSLPKPPNLASRTILQKLAMENQIRPTDAPEIIKIEEIKEGYKTWKDKTSTSPSNRHIGY